MAVQIVILILIYLYYQIQKNQYGIYDNKGRRNLLVFSGILIILQSGLRNFAIGADTYAYFDIFKNVEELSWEEILFSFKETYIEGEGKDAGYIILQKIFQLFLPDYRCFLIFTITIFIHSLFRLIYKFKISLPGILISVSLYYALFYSFFSITGIRQTVAAAITLYLVPYALNRKFFSFFIPLLLAATIHKSVLIFALFYYFPIIKNCNLSIKFAFICFLPMWVFGQSIGKYLIAGTIFDTYEAYLDGKVETNGALGFSVLILLVGILCLKFINKTKSTEWNPFIHAIAFAIFYTPMTSIGPSQMRIIQYFSIFLLILLPKLIKEIYAKYNTNSHYETLVFIFFSFYAIFKQYQYAFFWEPMHLGANYIGHYETIIGW